MLAHLDLTDARAELDGILPKAFADVRSQQFPLPWLTDREFELLALAIAESSAGDHFDAARVLLLGADQGRDVILLRRGSVVGALQCKHRVCRRLSLPEILVELFRFALRVVRDRALAPDLADFRYELWTSEEITEPAQRFFDAPRQYLSTHRGDFVEIASRARKGIAALASENAGIEAGENDAALDVLSAFSIGWVGPTKIRQHLSDDDRLRRRFFRGPDDAYARPAAAEIEREMVRLRTERAQRALRNARYVPRKALQQGLEDFLAGPRRDMGVIAGSGEGKSTWVGFLAQTPPPTYSVDVIYGEEIREDDLNATSTLARILRSRPLLSSSTADMEQAIWEWWNSANRLVVVDGLDRISAAVRPRLRNWLDTTQYLTKEMPTRFICTSRPGAWRALDLKIDANITLPPLSEAEAQELCIAYGLDHLARSTRTPRKAATIARFANLQHKFADQIVTRLTVWRATLMDLANELERRGMGNQQFSHLIDELGMRLIRSVDGRVDVRELRQTAPTLVSAIDRLLELDAAQVISNELRLQPDDLAAYVMASQIDADRITALLSDRENEDLINSAAAMAVAMLHRANPSAFRIAMDTLATNVSPFSPAFNTAARAILELEDREAMLSEAKKLLMAWHDENFLLAVSALGEMIDAIPLPAADRLQLMLEIIDNEDNYDWRPKYWLDPELVSQRAVSPFGRAAARAIHEDTVGCIGVLARLLSERTELHESVALGLFFEAVTADPHATLNFALGELFSNKASLFWNLSRLRPMEAAQLLGDSSPDAEHAFEKAVEQLWHLTSSPPHDAAALSLLRPTLAAAAVKLLPRAPNDRLRSLLTIISALGSPDPATKEALEKCWLTVPDHAFWLGVEALPDRRLSLIRGMLQHVGIERDRAQILGSLPPSIVPRQEWRELQEILLAAAQDAELEPACALAVEMLLYRAESAGGIEPFEKVAFQLARSPNGQTRRSLIYFAGSPVRIGGGSSHHRGLLFDALIKAETGTNLRPIIWKLLQSAPERSHVLEHLRFLVVRFGVDAIDSELARYWRIEAAGAKKVLQEWRSAPESTRPALPTITEAIAR